MKYSALALVVIGAALVWWFSFGAVEAPVQVGNTYTSATHHISFSYPDGYILEERDESGAHVITLINEDNLPLPESGEGPTAITIQITPNAGNQTADQWIRSSPLSNFRLSGGTPAEVIVGTQSALAFAWDGLYPGTTIVQARKDNIYAFSVTYLTTEDPIRTHFAQVVASAAF